MITRNAFFRVCIHVPYLELERALEYLCLVDRTERHASTAEEAPLAFRVSHWVGDRVLPVTRDEAGGTKRQGSRKGNSVKDRGCDRRSNHRADNPCDCEHLRELRLCAPLVI